MMFDAVLSNLKFWKRGPFEWKYFVYILLFALSKHSQIPCDSRTSRQMSGDLLLQVSLTNPGSRKGLPDFTQLYIAGLIAFPLDFIS